MNRALAIMTAVFFSMFLLLGCGGTAKKKEVTQQDLQKLKEAEDAAEAAIKELHKKRVEKEKLEAEQTTEDEE
jgi:preprotein translocase subunit SecG